MPAAELEQCRTRSDARPTNQNESRWKMRTSTTPLSRPPDWMCGMMRTRSRVGGGVAERGGSHLLPVHSVLRTNLPLRTTADGHTAVPVAWPLCCSCTAPAINQRGRAEEGGTAAARQKRQQVDRLTCRPAAHAWQQQKHHRRNTPGTKSTHQHQHPKHLQAPKAPQGTLKALRSPANLTPLVQQVVYSQPEANTKRGQGQARDVARPTVCTAATPEWDATRQTDHGTRNDN